MVNKEKIDIELIKLIGKSPIEIDKKLKEISESNDIKLNVLKSQIKYLEEDLKKRERETQLKQMRETQHIPSLNTKPLLNKDIINTFNSPQIIKEVLKELGKDHIKDKSEKVFLFFSIVSGLLKPSYRISTAVLGDSSVGKDNIILTIYKHMPDEKMLVVTRITGATLEDDITGYPIIYIGEGNFQREDGSNKSIIEFVKGLAEGGLTVWKKDIRKGSMGELRKEQQEKRCVIYSTTDTDKDEEIGTRFALVSIRGYNSKTQAVNINTLTKASDFKKELAAIERNEIPSWIKIGLSHLSQFDMIHIPFANLLNINSKDPRSQRDLKRFLNLIRAITWFCQRQRFSFIYKNKKILIAEPEDFFNAIQMGEDIFAQSLSGIEKRIEDTFKAIEILKDKYITVEELEGLWLKKIDLQEHLNIKRRDTLNKRLKILVNLTMIDWETKANNSYIRIRESASISASKERLISDQINKISTKIEDNFILFMNSLKKSIKEDTINYQELDAINLDAKNKSSKVTQLDAKRTLIRRQLDAINRVKTECLDFKTTVASNFNPNYMQDIFNFFRHCDKDLSEANIKAEFSNLKMEYIKEIINQLVKKGDIFESKPNTWRINK